MLLWDSDRHITVVADARQEIYTKVTVSADSEQKVYIPNQIIADAKQLISSTYAINSDTKHIITSVYSVQADILNSIFSPFLVEVDTQQIIYPEVEVISNYLEIKTADGDTVAFLSPGSDDLKECWINEDLNGACTIEFEMPLTSDKWQYLTDQYRIYAGDREFAILNPDAVDKERDGKKLTGRVRANEVWTLLGKKYKTITNDPLRPNPPWAVVAILSGGADLSGARYIVGTAGHALYALLQGTGWEVGTVDVGGIYDLETEKETILANINQVQETWGGYLVWDSINKTVSLRSEEAWKNYTGFQVRYAKNLKGIARTDDYSIITRLYPFGENDLNISNVNDGLLYLDDNSYTDEIYEGIWHDQNIHDQQELKSAGLKQLAKMCRPRHNYKTEILDLRVLDDYKHEVFALGDMADVIDEDLGVSAQQRIIRHRFNVFQPWLCEIEAGDPIEKIAASLADSIKSADYIKTNVKPNPSFQNILKAIIDTAATEINGANGDYTLVDGVSSWFDRDENGELTGKLVRITPKGLIISEDGGQTWNLAIDGEGINANAVTTGILNAALVNIISAGGNVIIDDTGMKVYDASDQLRVQIGEHALNNYGLKVIGGEIYSSLIRSGAEGGKTFIQFTPPNKLEIYSEIGGVSVKQLEILAASGFGSSGINFFESDGDPIPRAGVGYRNTGLEISTSLKDLNISSGRKLSITGDEVAIRNLKTLNDAVIGRITPSGGVMQVVSDLQIQGDAYVHNIRKTGTNNHIEPTENYGIRLLNAVESSELLYYDRGFTFLKNGEISVVFDPIFLECIEPDTEATPWQVWVECYGENGVYVSEIGEDHFKVKERNGGTSNNKIIWRFEATRKNYAGIRLMELIGGDN